jgi:hypothetical protein
MIFVVKAIGIIMLTVGVVFAAKPSLMRAFLDFAKVDKRYYIGGVVRIIFGALLLLSVPKVAYSWVVGVVGVIITLAGVALFVVGEGRVHAVMNWLQSKSDDTLRVFPVLCALVGVLLIYAA